jgi:SAM-dependent methyltransferase
VIVYDHAAQARFHTVDGARAALRAVFPAAFPSTVLDLGCATGTWLKACAERGAVEMVGLEFVDIPQGDMLIPKHHVRAADLCKPINLERTFELVICLETAEHLRPECSETLVDTMTRHADRILFSAAAPGQPGMNHINCQWPSYWQLLFNARGFVCDDSVRWTIWDNDAIEPWYRQNLMMVCRDPGRAGSEPRIPAVLHPDMVKMNALQFLDENAKIIQDGAMPLGWYPIALAKALRAKARRRLGVRT